MSLLAGALALAVRWSKAGRDGEGVGTTSTTGARIVRVGVEALLTSTET